MRKFLIGLAIFGVIAAIAGGVIFAIGYSQSKDGNQDVSRTVDVNETFENLDIDVMTSNVTFKHAVDGQNKVEIVEKEKIHNDVKVENNTLKIKQVDDRKWYEKMFDWNWALDKLSVTVYVTENTFSAFNCSSHTGSIEVTSGFTFESLKAKSNTGSVRLNSDVTGSTICECDTGSVTLSDLTTSSVYAVTHTGSINLTNVTVSGNITASDSTGTVNLNNVHCNNLDVECGTGSVNVNNSIAVGNMKIEASTGSIRFTSSDAASLNLKTSTGSIKGTLLTAKIFQAKSSTGSVRVPTSTTGGLCVAETTTGSIDLSIVSE